MTTPCPFCSMPSDRIVAGNDLAFAVRDAYPISPGHTLIIVRRHVASFFEVNTDERNVMLLLLDQAKEELEAQCHPSGYNIGINDGADAGQTVPHVHIHLIPRYRGDTEDPRGGVRWVLPERVDYWTGR